MCPNTLFWYAAILIITVMAISFYRQLFNCVETNFEALSTLIQQPQRQSNFFGATLTGFYHGKNFYIHYNYLDNGENRTITMEPATVPIPQKKFLFTYPRPTQNTIWRGNKVAFSPPLKLGIKSNLQIFTLTEWKNILEELHQGTAVIEKGNFPN